MNVGAAGLGEEIESVRGDIAKDRVAVIGRSGWKSIWSVQSLQ